MNPSHLSSSLWPLFSIQEYITMETIQKLVFLLYVIVNWLSEDKSLPEKDICKDIYFVLKANSFFVYDSLMFHMITRSCNVADV